MDRYVIVATVGTFCLGCVVTFAAMHSRQSFDECLIEQARGVPRALVLTAYSICDARHPNR